MTTVERVRRQLTIAGGIACAARRMAPVQSPAIEADWSGGSLGFTLVYGYTTAPSGAIVVALTDSGSINGAVLHLTIPSTVTEFGLTLPTGYTETSDDSLQWWDGATLDGFDPWVLGIAQTLMLKINTTAKTISRSSRNNLSAALPAGARLYRLASGVGSVDTAARNRDGTTQSETATNTASTAVADPISATRYSDFGVVLQGANDAAYRIPISGGTSGYTIMGWHFVPAGESTLAAVGAPNGRDLLGVDARMGLSWTYPDTDHVQALNPSAITGSLSMVSSVYGEAANYGNLRSDWRHVALVCRDGAQEFWLDGTLLATGTISASATWAAGVATGEGCKLFNGAEGSATGAGIRLARICVVGAAVSRVEIAAHIRATAAPSSGIPHVVTIGSSLQNRVPDGGAVNLSEATRLAASYPTTHWHNYASNGAAASWNGMEFPGHHQATFANYWTCRGGIAIVDAGMIYNAPSSDYATEATRFEALIRRIVDAGWRVISLDCGYITTVGATIRALQDAAYAKFGASLLRLHVRELLGADWNQQSPHYDDFIHFSQASVDALAPALAAEITQLAAQSSLITAPGWI